MATYTLSPATQMLIGAKRPSANTVTLSAWPSPSVSSSTLILSAGGFLAPPRYHWISATHTRPCVSTSIAAGLVIIGSLANSETSIPGAARRVFSSASGDSCAKACAVGSANIPATIILAATIGRPRETIRKGAMGRSMESGDRRVGQGTAQPSRDSCGPQYSCPAISRANRREGPSAGHIPRQSRGLINFLIVPLASFLRVVVVKCTSPEFQPVISRGSTARCSRAET